MAQVTVYSTPTCPYCRQLKQYLQEKGVSYQDKDVATDLEARKKMVDISGQLGVPVIEVDGRVIVGLDKEELDKALKM